jgi:hypothetical protein
MSPGQEDGRVRLEAGQDRMHAVLTCVQLSPDDSRQIQMRTNFPSTHWRQNTFTQQFIQVQL